MNTIPIIPSAPPSCFSSPKTICQALPAKAEWKLTQLPRGTQLRPPYVSLKPVCIVPIPVNIHS